MSFKRIYLSVMANVIFPSILDVDKSDALSAKSINQARDKRDEVFSDWIECEPVIFNSLESFSLKGLSRFAVDLKSIWYECLFIPNLNSDVLFVSLSGGGRTDRNRYPRFLRWKYANKLNANMLCIDDPMYKGNDFKAVKWYYGTKNVSYLKEMVPIIEAVSAKLKISRRNIYFLGSSGGGYAANYMANIMDGTNAISMNPQFVLKNWGHGSVRKVFKVHHNIDISDENDIHNRNNFIITSKNSVFFEIINMSSKEDFDAQFIPFSQNNGVTPKYGISSSRKNVITWLHCTDSHSPHSANPTDLGILIARSLIEHYRKYKELDSFYNLSQILNEEIRSKYVLHSKMFYINEWKKRLKSICYVLPSDVIMSYNLDNSYVRFVFKSLLNKKNIYYQISRPKITSEDENSSDGKYIYSFSITREPEIVQNEDVILFFQKICKLYKLRLIKNTNSLKIQGTCGSVVLAIKQLKKFIESSNEVITTFLKPYLK